MTRKQLMNDFSCVAGNSEQPTDKKTGKLTTFVLRATQNSNSTRKLAMDNLFYVSSN
jgi:hypothetical protein